MQREFDAKRTRERMVHWIRETVSKAGLSGVVVGLSGGIDSSVTAAVGSKAFPDDSLGIIMPCHSAPSDREHALLVAEKFHLTTETVNLEPVYERLMEAMGDEPVGSFTSENLGESRFLADANVKPRLRMTVLYYFAQKRGYLVLGTGNLSEIEMGYFTKYGDEACDIRPLARFTKGEVYQLAEELDMPSAIMEKPPSAGLWTGQTDEEEMGFTYQQLDRYLLGGSVESETARAIEELRHKTAHKRQDPPTFEPNFR